MSATRTLLLGRDVGRGEAAVHEEGRAVHVRRLVGGEEERAVHNLARLGEAAGRPMGAAALQRCGIVAEDREQKWRLDRARAERVDPDVLPRELNRSEERRVGK